MAIEIGVVEDVQLDAFGTPPQEEKRELGRADDVFADEVVETVRDGSLHLKFLDNTDFRLGSSAKVELDKFVYDPDAKAGELGINLGQGIFRMVTGDMPSEAITINTPIATMGVRGTDWVALLTANALVIFVVKGSIWVKPLFGENIQEYIVNALETASVSLSGRVTFGVDMPEYDPGLGPDLVEVMVSPQAGEPLGPGGDGIFSGGSILPFNPANLFRLVQVILERAAPNDSGGGTELPEEFAFAVVPGNSTDSNILFNALFGPVQDGTPAPAETPVPVTVIVLVTTPEATVTPVAVTITPTDDGGTDVVVTPIDPGTPELFTTNPDDVDLSDIDEVYSLLNIDPGSATPLDDLRDFVNANDLNVGNALAGNDVVILPDELDEFREFVNLLFDNGIPFFGGEGDDTIVGGNAFDIIAGGIGSTDTLSGEGDADILYGDLDLDLAPDGGTALVADDDFLEGGDGEDALYGDVGNNITASGSATTATGGNDTIFGDEDPDVIYGDAGNDILGNLGTASGGGDTLYGGGGGDTIFSDAGNDIRIGTSSDGTARGGDDVAYGEAGDDVIYGDAGGGLDDASDGNAFGGSDMLFGGTGNDILYGDSGGITEGAGGGDTLQGDDGNDTLYGDAGLDLDGGFGGGDLLYGGDGNDVVYGDAGTDIADSLSGGGNDTLYGDLGQDTLYGDAGGTDNLNGGNDTLFGGAEIDALFGGSGNDTQFGGAEDDLLYGNEGADSLTGGSGDDDFFYRAGDGGNTLALADVISDFDPGTTGGPIADRIGLLDGLTFDEGTSVAAGVATFLELSEVTGGATDTTAVLVISDGTLGGFEQVLAVLTDVDRNEVGAANVFTVP